LRLLDFNQEAFLNESIFIFQVFPGAFAFGDLENLDFDDYEYVLAKAKKVNKDG